MIGELTDKITRTEYIPINKVFRRIAYNARIHWYDPEATNPNYNPEDQWSTETGYWNDKINGGYYGKIKVQWYIPKGCRAERIRIIGV